MDLRTLIIEAIGNNCYAHRADVENIDEAADAILAIPEIKEALAYMKAVDSAHPVFHEIREMLDRDTPSHG